MANKNKRTLYLVFIFILLLTNIVAGYFWLNSNKDKETLQEEKSALQTEYMSVQQDLNAQIAELNAMKGKNATLDSILTIREQEIAEQQAKISKLFKQKNFSTAQLKKAKDMIASLELQNAGFIQKIDSLNSYADKLMAENETLTENLTTEKANNATLTDLNKHLGDKVEIASLLRAEELKAAGIFVRKNGVEKEVPRLKRVEKIRVCYQTGNNKVREKGAVKMYLRLITPSGKTFYNETKGSGTFTAKDGKDIRYSKEADFDFDGKNKNVCIYWTETLTEAGQYKAIIYQEGYAIGETTFDLK